MRAENKDPVNKNYNWGKVKCLSKLPLTLSISEILIKIMSNTNLHFILAAHNTLFLPETSTRRSTQRNQRRHCICSDLLARNPEMHCSISFLHTREGIPGTLYFKHLEYNLIEGSFLIARSCHNVFVIC